MMNHLNISELLIRTVIGLSVVFWLGGCSTGVESSNGGGSGGSGGDDEWLVPPSKVIDGGPGRDGIPSIEDPKFKTAADVTMLSDDDLVIGVKVGSQVRAYPNIIMTYHEIVNDVIGGTPVAITFCPLTGSPLAWNRDINGSVTEFGVSGLIYKNNLIPFDRNTESLWSQMLLTGIHGNFLGEELPHIQVIETEWGTWKQAFPDSEVMVETEFDQPYDRYLYGDYRFDHNDILFPVENTDDRLQKKDRIHGLLSGGTQKAYPIANFRDGIEIINDDFAGNSIVIIGSSDLNIGATYSRTIDGTLLQFSGVQNALPVVMTDQEGNRWNLFGEAVEGPRTGARLESFTSYNAYWFAWVDFFPQTFLSSFDK